MPILDRLGEIIILEPGKKFFRSEINGKRVTYKVPEISGDIHYKDNSFDLITCLGVLHHIPNVEHIISEFYRVLKPGGFLLIREPITSMNIFTRETNLSGATVHERGIPKNILKNFLLSVGFNINSENIYGFRLFNFLGKIMREKKMLILIDWYICQLFSFNEIYHAKNIFQKFQAGHVAFVAKKT